MMAVGGTVGADGVGKAGVRRDVEVMAPPSWREVKENLYLTLYVANETEFA